jgi:hypothetical protein
VFAAAETAAVIAGALTSGADAREAPETAALIAGALTSGADVATRPETGSTTAGALTSGGDVDTAIDAGSVTAAAASSGADTAARAETGAVTPEGITSAADALAEHTETGSVTPAPPCRPPTRGSPPRPARSSLACCSRARTPPAVAEAGSLIAQAILTGADVLIDTQTGSVMAGAAALGRGAEADGRQDRGAALDRAASGADAAELLEHRRRDRRCAHQRHGRLHRRRDRRADRRRAHGGRRRLRHVRNRRAHRCTRSRSSSASRSRSAVTAPPAGSCSSPPALQAPRRARGELATTPPGGAAASWAAREGEIL